MNSNEIYEKVVGCIVNACGIDAEEITPAKTLVGDLGVDSIDLLTIVFEMENAFDISIQIGGLEAHAREQTEGPFEVDSVLTDAGLATIRKLIPELPDESLQPGVTIQQIPFLITVGTFCKLVERELEKQGK